MVWKDTLWFLGLFLAAVISATLIQSALGKEIDEYDLIHAAIVASTITILNAIRETRK